MSYEHVIWERDGGVGRITLNRPDSLNAWTGDFGRELKQVIEGDAAVPAVRTVLITGAGRGGGQRAGRGNRRVARVRLRPGAGRGVRLLRARVREHRPDAGRRVDPL